MKQNVFAVGADHELSGGTKRVSVQSEAKALAAALRPLTKFVPMRVFAGSALADEYGMPMSRPSPRLS